jgi:hypothetical protein
MALRAGLNNIMTTLRRRSNEPAAANNAAAAAANQQQDAAAGAAGPAGPLLAAVSSATSVASNGTATGTPTASPAGVHNPVGVVADKQGNVYVADAGNYRWASTAMSPARNPACSASLTHLGQLMPQAGADAVHQPAWLWHTYCSWPLNVCPYAVRLEGPGLCLPGIIVCNHGSTLHAYQANQLS